MYILFSITTIIVIVSPVINQFNDYKTDYKTNKFSQDEGIRNIFCFHVDFSFETSTNELITLL
jgi:hypothetical protein